MHRGVTSKWNMNFSSTSGIGTAGTRPKQTAKPIPTHHRVRLVCSRLGRFNYIEREIVAVTSRLVKHLLQRKRQLGFVAAAGLSSPSAVSCPQISRCNAGQMSSGWATLSRLFTYTNFVHAVSGSVGSFVSMTVFFPLDTARTRLQVDDHRKAQHSPQVIAEILKEEGVQGLYRGWWPVISALCCSNFVYFYTYSGLKAAVLGERGKAGALSDLSLAFVAGVINVLVTTPLWVANTRLKLQGAKMKTEHYKDKAATAYRGVWDCLQKVWRQEGLLALWSGTLPSIVLAANPAIVFMVYEALKRYLQLHLKSRELSGILYFIIGAIAKTVATVITYPLQVIQSRLRAGFSQHEKSHSMLQHLMLLVRRQGLAFLYKGLEAKLLQTVLTAALMFLTYEKMSSLIFSLMGISPSAAR